jgi:two-component system sensor histidine kinase/response regulator
MTAVAQETTAFSGSILLAEDNAVSRRVAEAMLQGLGFQVDVVVDGAEAVRVASLTPYRAILMDCQIPVLDGYEATGQIRHLEGGRRRTPIIAVTALAASSNQERCIAAGMDDFVAKPLTSASLAAVLSHWIPDGSSPSIALDPAGPPPNHRVHMAHAAESTRPVLDPDTLAGLYRLGGAAGEDLVGQLAVLFAADADAHILALRGALAAEDDVLVSREAHTLSGASLNIGATKLALCCDVLSSSISADIVTGDLPHAWALLDLVEAELVRVHSALSILRNTP